MNGQWTRSAQPTPSVDVGVEVIGAHVQGLFLGLLLAVVPALILNAHYGLAFAEPLDGVLEPRALAWMLGPGAAALAFTVYGAWARRPVLFRSAAMEAVLPFFHVVLAFWLWLHGAYAFLWPFIVFTVFYGVVRAERWRLTETQGPRKLPTPLPSRAAPGAAQNGQGVANAFANAVARR